MKIKKFNVDDALNYAYKWALSRNPIYYNFDNIALGGDCTNFISQCLYAGCNVMNYTKNYGWYYQNINNRSPSWTGVQPLYNFLISNRGLGPFAQEVTLEETKPGDIIQLSFDNKVFSHSLIILEVGLIPHPDNILIACHSRDALFKSLSEYYYQKIRFIHVLGVRVK